MLSVGILGFNLFDFLPSKILLAALRKIGSLRLASISCLAASKQGEAGGSWQKFEAHP
jgi:hypothetical protein